MQTPSASSGGCSGREDRSALRLAAASAGCQRRRVISMSGVPLMVARTSTSAPPPSQEREKLQQKAQLDERVPVQTAQRCSGLDGCVVVARLWRKEARDFLDAQRFVSSSRRDPARSKHAEHDLDATRPDASVQARRQVAKMSRAAGARVG